MFEGYDSVRIVQHFPLRSGIVRASYTMDRHPPSLKNRLIVTLTVALALLAVAVNFAVFQFIHHLDLEEFDSELKKQIDMIATMTTVEELDPIEIEMELDEFDPPDFQPSSDAKYYQIWDHQNKVFMRSRSLGESDIPNLAAELGKPVFDDIELPDGRAGRMVSMAMIAKPQTNAVRPDEIALLEKYRPGPEFHLALSLASSREELNRVLGIEMALSVLTAVILIGGAVGIVHLLINRSFRKFEQLAGEMRNIDYATLSTRLPEDGLPREFLPFATQFNNLLARLQGGVERENRFVTNISHELRTPVSELRLLTEVGQRECDRGEMVDVANYFKDATELTIKMDRLIETVSAFNHLASGREKPVIEAFHLSPILDKACAAHSRKATERELKIVATLIPDTIVKSDKSLVSAILSNLIGNATSHAPIGSTIYVSVSSVDSIYRVEIENPNTELELDDLGKLGEPFWQKDSARSGDEHFGMGIALVESYCQLIGISCAFSLPKSNLFRACIEIQAAETMVKSPRSLSSESAGLPHENYSGNSATI
ncbi:MAG: signal transduction histidine kinase [Verrucomicrobiales bacterium]|jgi:signal transduction histidine kinase